MVYKNENGIGDTRKNRKPIQFILSVTKVIAISKSVVIKKTTLYKISSKSNTNYTENEEQKPPK